MTLSSLFALSAILLSAALPTFGQAPAPVRLGELGDRPVVDAGGAKIYKTYRVYERDL